MSDTEENIVGVENESFHRKYPFEGLPITKTTVLNEVTGRSACIKCKKSRKLFCYTCYIPVQELVGKIPQIRLPVKIDIIKHKNEIDGKSTATHAALIAPDDVKIYTYPDIPDYTKEEGVVLIFPSPQSVSIANIFTGIYEFDIKENFGLPKGFHMGTLLRFQLKEIIKTGKQEADADGAITFPGTSGATNVFDECDLPIKRAVFIDSTWNQSRGIYRDERISSMKSVVLQNRASQFWRHQRGSPRWYLATIEAIHQFLIEIHMHAWGVAANYIEHMKTLEIVTDFIPANRIIDTDYDPDARVQPYHGQYDNLLFFFMYMYDLIHMYYDHQLLKSYKRPFI